jgi:hypothetical protein
VDGISPGPTDQQGNPISLALLSRHSSFQSVREPFRIRANTPNLAEIEPVHYALASIKPAIKYLRFHKLRP